MKEFLHKLKNLNYGHLLYGNSGLMINLDILKYFPSIISGNPQHFFIISENKTLLANNILDASKKEFSMITAHINCSNIKNIEDFIIQIIGELLNSINSKKIFDYLQDNIEIVDGDLKPSDSQLRYIKDNFAFCLNDLVSIFKNPLFIVIDDISSLTNIPEFANWYKSFVDTMATSIDFMPIGIMLTGCCDDFKNLYKQNSSLNRVFHTFDF